MRRNFIFLLTLVTLLACVFVHGRAMAQGADHTTVEWVTSEQGYSNGQTITNVQIDPYIRAVFAKDAGSSAPAYYNSGAALRWYPKNTLTVAPDGGARIYRIEYWAKKGGNYSQTNPLVGIMTTNEGIYTDVVPTSTSNPVASVWESTEGLTDNKGVTIKLNGTSGHRRLTKIVVEYSVGSTGELRTLTYNVNDGTEVPATVDEQYVDNAHVTVKPFAAFSSFVAPDNHIFDQWNTMANGLGTSYDPGATFNITSNTTLYAQWIDISNGLINYLTPATVNPAFSGTTSGYADWSLDFRQGGKTWTYKGNSYKQNDYLQLRGSGNSGIVTTSTVNVGTVASVEVTWNANTTDGRVLQVYGKNTPYESPEDLYGANQGTLLGEITKGTNTSIAIEGSYSYIGLRVASNAAFFDDIRITWNDGGASEDPAIEFAPQALSVGNVPMNEQLSRDFVVSPINIEAGTVHVTASYGSLKLGDQQGQTVTIEGGSGPQTITWTFTPTHAGQLSETVTAQWYNGDNEPTELSATMNITGYVYNETAPVALSAAKSNFINQGNTVACIDLADVEVIGRSGNNLFLQDASAGLLVYGTLPEVLSELTTGCKFTGGVLVGTFVNYQNTVVELQDFQFVNATWIANQTLTSVAVLNPNQSLMSAEYQHRYVKLTNVTLTDWKIREITNYDLYINDLLSPGITLLTPPETNQILTISGLLNYAYSSSTSGGVYTLVPTDETDIHADVAAAAPNISPAGGSTESSPTQCLTVTLTPATKTTLSYMVNGGETFETTSAVTINITGQTTISGYVRRDFYVSQLLRNHYYDIPTNVKTVTFDINGTTQNVYVATGSRLNESQIPAVAPIEDFTLAGWSLWSNGPSTDMVDPLSVTINDNTTFHAVYAKASNFEYRQVTEVSGMIKGTYIIMGYDGAKNYLMKNEQGSGNPAAYEIGTLGLSYTSDRRIVPASGTYITDEMAGPLTWSFEPMEGNAWAVRSAANNAHYLASMGNNTNVSIGNQSTASWTVSKDQFLPERLNMKSNNSQRYLTLYQNMDWRAYTTDNMYNIGISHPDLFIFKKTPVFTDGDTKYNRVFCDETATANINLANVGKAIIPSGHYLKMAGYSLTNTDATRLVIEDGATFTPAIGATQPMATVKKHIGKYTVVGDANTTSNGWVLLGSPVGTVRPNGQVGTVDDGSVSGLMTTASDFDLYSFNAAQTYEWQNIAVAGNENMTFGNGPAILYGNAADVDITFTGSLTTEFSDKSLTYEGNGTFVGWNLVGNPFVCDATISRDYIRMNSEGTELITGNGSVGPMEGVFVQATHTGETYSFTPDGAQRDRGLITIEVSRNADNTKATAIIDRVLVRFGEGATLGKMMLNEANTKLYVTQGGKDYAVVRAMSEGEMPISFKASVDGSYTLTVTTSNVEMNYLHLIDNMTGADVDLLQTPSYTFTAKTTDYASRFRLVFDASQVTDPAEGPSNFAYFNGSSWMVSNMGEATLQVVDVMGRVLSSETINGNAEVSLNHLAGLYLLRLVNGSDVKVQKIVVR